MQSVWAATILEGNIDPPPLGLRLNIEELMKSTNERLNVSKGAKESPSQPKKFPVAHFAPLSLTIGEFKVHNAFGLQLVARISYARRKIAWEIFYPDTNRKHKIEVPWDNILAMRALAERNMLVYLEIMLEKEPQFYRETDPRPRCRTSWELTEDFTGGHALRYRTHSLVFPVGVLNKPYETMIQSDSRLLQLGQRPFPSSDSPFFHSDGLYDVPISYAHHDPAYSSPPTYGNVNVLNVPLPQGPNMPLASEGLDGRANNLQSYSVPGAARDEEFILRLIEKWFMDDDDEALDKLYASSIMMGNDGFGTT